MLQTGIATYSGDRLASPHSIRKVKAVSAGSYWRGQQKHSCPILVGAANFARVGF